MYCKKTTAIITGANGFIGRALIRLCVEQGIKVVANDLQIGDAKIHGYSARTEIFRFVEGDFAADDVQSKVSDLIMEDKGGTIFFHMAGLAHSGQCVLNPKRAFDLNVALVFKTLEYCRMNGIGKYIFPSTGIVYLRSPEKRQPFTESDLTAASDIYSATKLSAESLVHGFSSSFGISSVIARLGNTYGMGGHDDTVVGTIVKQAREKGVIAVRDYSVIRDFVHVSEIAGGLLRLMNVDAGAGCTTVNLSSGTGTTVLMLAQAVCKSLSLPLDRIDHGNVQSVSNSYLVLDNTLLKKMTGWAPEYDIETGLKLTLGV